ncbi:ras-GEF domain-containing family member 1B-like isoform X3 [Apostichopus japonicus]|uniref:ras-GEF domain-containing family member 1B-like isoform X3 n=1 Tax=Stichopus japonicus TaxID=307972 RepID=UPI003AB49CD5
MNKMRALQMTLEAIMQTLIVTFMLAWLVISSSAMYLWEISQSLDFLQIEKEQTIRKGSSEPTTAHLEETTLTRAVGLLHQEKDKPSIFGTIAHDSPAGSGVPPTQIPGSSNGQPATLPRTSKLQGNKTTVTVKPFGERDLTRAALVYEDGNLVAGSLEACIQHLVPTADYYPDRTFIFAFLLSSRLYIKPHQLMHDICQICIRQQRLNGSHMERTALIKFGTNFMQLLSEWTETFAYDFKDERMMKHLREITQKLSTLEPTLKKTAGQIIQGLFRKLGTLEKYEDVLVRVNMAASERMHALRANPASFQVNIMDICPEPHVLAQQLTHIELERLTNIGPEEFVQSFIKESTSDSKNQKFQDIKRTRNLEAYVEWFNRLSYLVATEVCMHIKKKHRAKLIEYFIDVARECFNIGNFNSLMAIMSGLNMCPVGRLKKTWGKVNMDKFEILEHQMDPTSNFTTYRQSLKAGMQRALTAQEGACDKIVIPFFSLLVKDLYFLNEGCSNKTDNGHINFQKFWQLAKQVTDFMTWKTVDCPYPRERQTLNYLLTAPVFSENSLHLASFESENPESDLEREQYKSLKLQCEEVNK